jgi:hypothetical protein
MRPFMSVLVLVCACAVLVGCSVRVGDFTVISTKNVDVGGKYIKGERKQGEDKAFAFIFPFGTPNLKNAVDACIEAGSGELLTNVVINYVGSLGIITAPLIGPFGYEVLGDVWSKATTGALYDPNVEVYELRVTTNGLELYSLRDENRHIQVSYILQ